MGSTPITSTIKKGIEYSYSCILKGIEYSKANMKGVELRYKLAKQAFHEGLDRQKPEQKIEVDSQTFIDCLEDKPEHHKEIALKRGFIRTFYKPYYIHVNGYLMYRHGIVNIILKGSSYRGYKFD